VTYLTGRAPTPLDDDFLYALESRNWTVALSLLKQGANPNIRVIGESQPALYFAASLGNVDMCDALIRAGAHLNFRPENQHIGAPLHIATENGFYDVCKVLIDAGADVNITTRTGDTAIHIAAGQHDSKIVELLLAAGADPNTPGPRGITPMHCTTAISWRYEVPGRAAVCRMLAAAGADINAASPGGITSLQDLVYGEAPGNGAYELTAVVLELGADPSLTPRNPPSTYLSALHMACAAGHLHFVRLFAERGADLESRTPDGRAIDELIDDSATQLALRSLRAEFQVHRSINALPGKPDDGARASRPRSSPGPI
jgi:ankyrin repeat protein